MNYNFFESFEYGFLGTIFFPVSIILLCISVFVLKNKKVKTVLSFILLFVFIEGLSFGFNYMSAKSRDINKEIKYMKISADIALIPYEKGTKYAELARIYANNKDKINAKHYYEKAHNFIKTYNDEAFLTEGLTYQYLLKDYDTAIKIYSEQKRYGAITICYILKEEYQTALEYAQKDTEKNPESPYGYAHLSIIYKNIGNEEEAAKNYQKAKSLCKDKVCFDRINEMSESYRTYFRDRIKD